MNVGLLAENSTRVAITALLLAACEGNVEFVKRVSNAYPTLLVLCDTKLEWNIFYAVAYRQAQIFDHIRVLHTRDMLASMRDHNRNTLLHVAAILDSPVKLKLDRITGPALQMQRELQWFKEVESVIPEWVKEHKNNKDLTPRELFKETHKELRKEGDEWMKSAATSGSVVAALVVTIMFTAAFTVPGGFDSNSGLPPLREKQRKWFMTFIFSDVISLIFSIASVLTFLTILTSRFDEEDFLMSLPTKLILGLFSLLMSIITMFIAFSANIVMVLEKTSYLWVYPPIILLAIVLVILFAWLQLSSFYEMVVLLISHASSTRK